MIANVDESAALQAPEVEDASLGGVVVDDELLEP